MVLGIILYETVDVLYAVSKITINSVKYIYNWYNSDEDVDIFVKIDKHGNIIDDSDNETINDSNKHIKQLGYEPELIYIKKIEELERKIKELNEKIDKSNEIEHTEHTENTENTIIKVNLKKVKEK